MNATISLKWYGAYLVENRTAVRVPVANIDRLIADLRRQKLAATRVDV